MSWLTEERELNVNMTVTHQLPVLTQSELCYAAAHLQHNFTACF